MFEIINDLEPFFEDCYRRIGVREFAKTAGISPATASSRLSHYAKQGILLRTKYRNCLLFYANKESRDFIDISRIYWRHRLKDLVSHLEKRLSDPAVILFGSLSKGETKEDSDIDIAVFAQKKDLKLPEFEKKLGRKIQIFRFAALEEAKNNGLANAILNGYLLRGRFSWTGRTA